MGSQRVEHDDLVTEKQNKHIKKQKKQTRCERSDHRRNIWQRIWPKTCTKEDGEHMHVNPGLIHVSVWQKPLQYCKVISLQLIKINGKKKEYLSQVETILRKTKLRASY